MERNWGISFLSFFKLLTRWSQCIRTVAALAVCCSLWGKQICRSALQPGEKQMLASSALISIPKLNKHRINKHGAPLLNQRGKDPSWLIWDVRELFFFLHYLIHCAESVQACSHKSCISWMHRSHIPTVRITTTVSFWASLTVEI